MNVEELQAEVQAAIDFDPFGENSVALPRQHYDALAEAAWLWLNPNIEAAARALAPTGVAEKWMPYFRDKATEAVAAALDTKQ